MKNKEIEQMVHRKKKIYGCNMRDEEIIIKALKSLSKVREVKK